MIKKLLIANRGEIASRIIRTARRLGIATVAVHSEADVRALHVEEADERVAIGPAAARDSYLKIEHIVAAAKDTGADAIHPGYGFLSENPELARTCRKEQLLFIGPPTEAIEAMASKVNARRMAQQAGVPVVPGSGALRELEIAKGEATRLGYPVLLKASAGGGGIGMERCNDEAALSKAFQSAQDRAQRFFGDGAVFLEKLLLRPRHIEVQVAADAHGHVIHLGERECSIQRRYQKVVEETPSTAVDATLRRSITEAAVALARAVDYRSLGTIELLVDDGKFYFLEMNTRLQVEHTVTEMVSGLDLVEWQIRIALGEKLPALQEQVRFEGHAIQCRIYAENPDKGFLPSPGQVTKFMVPVGPGIRNDVGVRNGDFVTPYYDPMIAKLVVHGPSRPVAIERLQRALADYQVEGITTNLSLHRRIAAHPGFAAGQLHTGFLREQLGLKA